MKFLVEILGMTNQCNLRCTYCDWKKEKQYKLTEEDKIKVKNNLKKIREMLDVNYPDVQLIEYSGGETLLYPEIISYLCEIFSHKWIRIISNGVLINKEIITVIHKHKKVFMAISLDGDCIEANRARFGNNEQLFGEVINNIDLLVKENIPVMILCTLSKFNIDFFPHYVQFLEKKYDNAIDEGKFVMPTHYVTNYSEDNGVPSLEQVQKFKEFILNEGKNYKLVNRIMCHYESLIKYAEGKRKNYPCTINEWNLSMHFRGNNIIDGGFLSFGCGMRGVMENGLFDLNDEKQIEEYLRIVSDEEYNAKFRNFIQDENIENAETGINELNKDCDSKCFVDWTIIDYILNGYVEYESAKNWFVLFQDSTVENWVKQYNAINEKD